MMLQQTTVVSAFLLAVIVLTVLTVLQVTFFHPAPWRRARF